MTPPRTCGNRWRSTALAADRGLGSEPVPMDHESQHQRLGEISTLWGLIGVAAGNSPEAVGAAQEALLARYGGGGRPAATCWAPCATPTRPPRCSRSSRCASCAATSSRTPAPSAAAFAIL